MTGRPYAWIRHPRDGIAPAPDWFVRWLAEDGTAGSPPRAAQSRPRTVAQTRTHDETIPESTTGPELGGRLVQAAATPRKVMLTRFGDRAILAAAMISRFPVPAFGHRHVQMTRAVGHLVGHGYDLDLVDAVMGNWYDHHHGLGVVRTEPDEAAQELSACIGSTVRSLERGKFRLATSDLDHEALGREIRLDAGQRELARHGDRRHRQSGSEDLDTGTKIRKRMPHPRPSHPL